MPQLSRASIFVRQNFWLKLIILILGSLSAIVIPVKALIYMVPITLLYLLLSPRVYKSIGKGLLTFLPFFASYSLLATLFGIPFPAMMMFILRLSVMIIFMVYFSASLSMVRLLEDCSSIQRYSFMKNLIFFLIATLLYIKRIRDYYQPLNKSNEKKKSIRNLIPNLIDAVEANWQERDKIEEISLQALSLTYNAPHFVTKSNLLGCIFITYLILILSI